MDESYMFPATAARRLVGAAAVMVMALASGCGGGATTKDLPDGADAGTAQTAPSGDNEPTTEADALIVGLPPQAAIARLLATAEDRPQAAAFTLRLRAVQLSIEHEPADTAAERLEELRLQYSDSTYQLPMAILNQQILLLQNKPQQALTNIEDLRQQADAASVPQIMALRADALSQAGLIIESVQLRVELDRAYAAAGPAKAQNRDKLWRSLQALPAAVIGDNIPPTPDTFSGWLELAYINKRYGGDSAGFDRALSGWLGRHSDHPANDVIVDRIRLEQIAISDTIANNRPRHIALVLPLSGPLQTAGRAIRDGFLAAYLESPRGLDLDTRPRVEIHDTQGKAEFGRLAVQRANGNGADMIVGPLDRSVVRAAIAAAAALQAQKWEQSAEDAENPGQTRVAPILALNNVPAESLSPAAEPRIYEFTLAPESEAVQAAERAGRDGRLNALVIAPDNAWGDRVYQAFAVRNAEFGGAIIAEHRFNRGRPQHAEGIQRAINLDRSKLRQRQIRQTLRQEVEFTPRPRGDLDMIFLAASASEARQIRPQLKFFYSGHIPVYATSHIYTGAPSPRQDRDLDGIHFADMPWVLDDKPAPGSLPKIIRDNWPDAAGQARFHALGADIFQLLPWLRWLEEHPEYTIDGGTGRLSLDPNGLVRRQARWAVFADGAPSTDPAVMSENVNVN